MNFTPQHAPEYVTIIKRLAPLIRTQFGFRGMRWESLCHHFAYHWNRGTFAYLLDDQGNPHGVCAVKFFRRLEDFLVPYVHDPGHKFCFIELLAADEPNAIAAVWEDLKSRWGPQQIVMWDRGERTENGAPRMYSWEQFDKLARRLTYGAIEHV